MQATRTSTNVHRVRLTAVTVVITLLVVGTIAVQLHEPDAPQRWTAALVPATDSVDTAQLLAEYASYNPVVEQPPSVSVAQLLAEYRQQNPAIVATPPVSLDQLLAEYARYNP